MKRGLVFTLCAAALVVGSSVAQAQNVQLSLNLRYTNPGDPDQGGKWYLAAKTDDADGIAGLSAYISNITPAGIVYGTTAGNSYTGITGAQIAAILNGGNPFAGTIGGTTNVVYGQDTSAAGIINGVGTTGFAQRQATDPLRNAAWANATIIASGTFAGGGNAGNQFNRPAFVAAGANSTDANTLVGTPHPVGTAATDAAVTLTVRGDSVVSFGLNSNAAAGLYFGDLNRNGTVSFLADVNPALQQIGQGAGKTWEQGDFNGNGTVSFLADVNPALQNIGLPATPAPAVGAAGAVPEPTSVGLLALGFAALAAARRRA